MKKFTLLKSLLLTAILLVGSGVYATTIFEDFEEAVWAGTNYTQRNVAATSGNWIVSGVGTMDANDRRVGERSIRLRGGTLPADATNVNRVEMNFDKADGIGTVSFKYASYSTHRNGVFNVEVSTNQGATWTVVGSTEPTPSWTDGGSVMLDASFPVNVAGNARIRVTRTPAASAGSISGNIDNLTITAFGSVSTVVTPNIQVAGNEKATDVFWNNADVTLSTATADATIHYTLDGSAPTTSSPVYSAPFNITANATIKAIAVKAGFENSAIAERTITIAPPAVATLPYTENFVGNLGEFYAYSVTGDQIWRAVTATGTHTTVASMNGFASGANNENEDWLISPRVPFNPAVIVSFSNRFNFTGDALKLKYSENYSGHGDPRTATWIDITDKAVWSEGSNAWAESGNIIVSRDDVLGIPKTVHIAFVYTSTTESGSQWQIANFSITEAPTTPTIVVAETSIPEMSARVGRPATQTITVSGMNLTGNIAITISGANANLFSVNPSSVAQSATSTAVTITYAPTAENGPHTATLRLNSAGAQEVTFELNGVVRPHTPVPDVIIVEVYGGGGNSGAPLKFDFVTLFNTTNENINIGGWSLQYLAAATIGTATAGNTFVFPENTVIAANDYFLIQFASQNEEVGAPLPVTPNLIGTINLAGAQGKIILYRTNERQPFTADIASITGNPHFQDYVPYGVDAVPVWGSVLANLSNTTSAQRKMEFGEYVHTQNVGNDFTRGTPNPRAGVSTGVETPQADVFNVFAHNGQITFNTAAGKVVEVYNVLGQMITSRITVEGLNTISVNVRGIAIVRVGNQTAKVKL